MAQASGVQVGTVLLKAWRGIDPSGVEGEQGGVQGRVHGKHGIVRRNIVHAAAVGAPITSWDKDTCCSSTPTAAGGDVVA
ncbi:hypothetical protein GCM10009626_42190 [Brachybacterium sacelli]